MQKMERSTKQNGMENNVERYLVTPSSVVVCSSKSERAQFMSNLLTREAFRRVEKGEKNVYVTLRMA